MAVVGSVGAFLLLRRSRRATAPAVEEGGPEPVTEALLTEEKTLVAP
jgi:hypothetical protein